MGELPTLAVVASAGPPPAAGRSMHVRDRRSLVLGAAAPAGLASLLPVAGGVGHDAWQPVIDRQIKQWCTGQQ